MANNDWDFETRAVHVGSDSDPETGALVGPIYQTSTYTYQNTDEAAKVFSGDQFGYLYSRIYSPTQLDLEKKIASLEGGGACKTFASGMAAISAVATAVLEAGDHVICDTVVYGGTFGLFQNIFSKYQIDASFVDTSDADKVANQMRANTKMMLVESPGNPTLKLVDIEKMSTLCQKNGVTLVVDNTFMTPYFQQPLKLGADIVVHSATKYMGGHGDLIAGAVVGSEEFIHQDLFETAKETGGVISPFTCFLVRRGLQTLPLRMEKHNANAKEVANYLNQQEKIEQVYFPGLSSSIDHELVHKQMGGGTGGMIAFEVKGGVEQGKHLCDGLNMIELGVSLGDAVSLIEHPASMTHASVPHEERMRFGISDGLIRLSVGIENADDIINDLDQALARV